LGLVLVLGILGSCLFGALTLCFKFQALADFQYIDSSGRDQGSNVRRKSQSLVSLVNDKERIQEVREKALSTKDK
jgi:epsin